MKKESKGMKRVVTVGTFDRVHRGHAKVLETLTGYARSHSLSPLVITFDRHPLETVAPDRAPGMLQSRQARDARLREYGVEVEEIEFTPRISSLSAGEWMEILRDRYGAVAFVSGYDNKFGCDGKGKSPDDYRELGKEKGLDVIVAPELPGVCSSAIRRALLDGDVEKAEFLAGRPYSLEGTVVRGRQIGRQIGFPTANLDVEQRIILPAPGVYYGELDGNPAVINIGDNPTVREGNPVTVEAYAIGFSGDLYGRRMEVKFIKRLRGEKKFGSLEELKRQIADDVREAVALSGR